jgi:hypothetical protein
VAASIVEVLGDHLVFLDAKGRLAAVFLLDLVEQFRTCRVWTDGLSAGFGVRRAAWAGFGVVRADRQGRQGKVALPIWCSLELTYACAY